MKFIPKQTLGVGELKISPKEKQYINAVIKSNRLSYGPFSQKLEKLFAQEHDCKYAVFCNSGTSALHISLAALKEYYGWKDGDEVIVPSVTFVATSNIVLHNNLKPVFVDVDPKTYNLNPALLEKALSKRTRCIIPVHLMGLPCEMRPIMAFAKKHKLRVIEDSCETMFASCNGKKVGSFGDIACFSTYIAHYIITGVGGFATTNNPKLQIILRSLMNHGRDSIYLSIDDDNNIKSKKKFHEIVSKRFSFVRLGHSFRVTELEAAMGLAQLERKEEVVSKRKANAEFLIKGLQDLSEFIQLPSVPKGLEHVYMLFPLATLKQPKTKLVEYLEDHKVETRELMPLISQPVYKKIYGNLEKKFPIATWVNQHGFYIGCHSHFSRKELQYIIDLIHYYFKK